jgi:hypothetical protein
VAETPLSASPSPAGLASAEDGQDPRLVAVLRLVLIAAQAATILLTWPVWQVRELPPLLPLLPVPQGDAGWLLLAWLAVAAVRPRIGVPAHSLALVWAILADQCRMQPHVISLTTLLWGTSGWRGGVVVMRAALVATWFYAGLHKLVSPDYYVISGPWLLRGVWPDGPPGLAEPLAAAVAVTEISLGLGAVLPRCRAAVGAAATAFHVATFLVLAFRLHWDRPVWPWNLALACAAPLILWSWRGPTLGASWREAPRGARGVAAALLLLPLGYWLGVVDAFLAHAIYSDDKPRAFVCTPFSRTDVNRICDRHGVVLPPAHRLFAPFFLGIGRPGEWLEVEDPRWIARVRGFDRRTIPWNDLLPAAGPAAGVRSSGRCRASGADRRILRRQDACGSTRPEGE